MTKYLLFVIISLLAATTGYCQITITADDMPLAHDTFKYSTVNIGAAINLGDSGTSKFWDYAPILSSASHGMDIYKSVPEVSPILAFTLPPSLYGYKVADSIPGLSLLVPGVSVQNLYTFFQKIAVPSAYVASAFSATINGLLPVGTSYTSPDVWYIFPLTYGRTDSNNFELNLDIPTIGTLTQAGYRKTQVDGWGTITTPYYTTPVNCIRVRSEIHNAYSVPGLPFAIPFNTVEYKWLVNGDHHPALWVTTSLALGGETITNIRYRDRFVDTISAVHGIADNNKGITAYPNPSLTGITTLDIPKGWTSFHVDVFDVQSKMIISQDNNAVVNLASLPAGNYVARVLSGTNMAFVTLVK